MIVISRCPCRISLIGGSSDLDWFVEKKGKGLSVGFAVASYSRVIIGYRGENSSRGLLNYSSREEYISIDSISHPIIRKCFQVLSVNQPIELASFGESFLGGGLASSSSFVVALVKSIKKLHNIDLDIPNEKIAELACEIELQEAKDKIGRQDQYMCALGGINYLSFKKNGIVKNNSYPLVSKAISKYAESLYIINSSISRSASLQLSIIKNDPESFNLIEKILYIAEEFISEAKNLSDIDLIINKLDIAISKSWEIKKDMKGVMNTQLFQIQDILFEEGFKVIKILGAGGGGYFLAKYQGSDIDKSLKKLVKQNIFIKQVPIDYEGCKTWVI